MYGRSVRAAFVSAAIRRPGRAAAIGTLALCAAAVVAGCGGGSATDLLAAKQGTARYKNYYTALHDDYVSGVVCAPGDLPPERGAAGIHLGNYRLIRDGQLDVRKPEILIYVPTETDYRLVAIEYVVPDTGQNAPTLFGKKFSRFDASDTPGFKAALPPGNPIAWYLHVWLYAQNPRGLFADSNPRLRCPPPPPAFTGPPPAVAGAGYGHIPESGGPTAGDFLHLTLDAHIDRRYGPAGRFDINHLNPTTGAVVTKLHGVVKCLRVEGKTAMISGVITKGTVTAAPGFDPAGETMAVTVSDRGGGKSTFAIDLSFLQPRHLISPCQPVDTDVVDVERGSFAVR